MEIRAARLGDRHAIAELMTALGYPGTEAFRWGIKGAADARAKVKRLADAVAALETIRLNLLKLHAGSVTVQSITTDLGLAEAVAQEVDRLLESRREVEELG